VREIVLSSILLALMVHGHLSAEATNSGVAAFEEKLLAARPLEISHVRLLGGPLKRAQDLDAEYLLKLEPDRMMAGYRLRAGLQPRAEGYGGWDSVNGKQLTGHIAGHYLSAVSYESGDRFWVNLYAPSTADWTAPGAKLTMETDLPEGESAKLTLTLEAPKEFTLALRRPSWVGEGFKVKVNGKAVDTGAKQAPPAGEPGRQRSNRRSVEQSLPPCGSYAELKRTWKTGDTVELTLPKTLRLEPLPDNPRRVAILWGPLVLAGDLGPEAQRRGRGARSEQPAAPVFVAAERPVTEWLKPVADKPGQFRTEGVGREKDVDFVPFYRLHRRTYGVYWDLFTPAERDK